ncbi:MAG: hypothetical protein WD097_02695 [Balneolales bacterium]
MFITTESIPYLVEPEQSEALLQSTHSFRLELGELSPIDTLPLLPTSICADTGRAVSERRRKKERKKSAFSNSLVEYIS